MILFNNLLELLRDFINKRFFIKALPKTNYIVSMVHFFIYTVNKNTFNTKTK